MIKITELEFKEKEKELKIADDVFLKYNEDDDGSICVLINPEKQYLILDRLNEPCEADKAMELISRRLCCDVEVRGNNNEDSKADIFYHFKPAFIEKIKKSKASFLELIDEMETKNTFQGTEIKNQESKKLTIEDLKKYINYYEIRLVELGAVSQ